jgi:hypothetical protein
MLMWTAPLPIPAIRSGVKTEQTAESSERQLTTTSSPKADASADEKIAPSSTSARVRDVSRRDQIVTR